MVSYAQIQMTDRERLILLNLIPDVGSTRLRRLLEACGSLERAWRATPDQLQQIEGIGAVLARRIADGCRDERRLAQELTRARQAGVAILTLDEAGYPSSLGAIHDPPVALYVKGTLTPNDRLAVGIVGSRRASHYGLQSAERLGYDLALRGITIVSGLARGIDAAAHEGALRAGGRTIAVLGSGLNRLYPPEHEALAARIATRGALISEYPMEAEPLPHHFPQRNRIISGLSLGVVVVEATQCSGALITADCALEQGREVFAVPGPMTAVTSQGTHGLLKQGARLVTSVEDILEELRLAPVPVPSAEATREEGGLTPAPVHAMVAHEPQATVASAGFAEHERRVLECVGAREPMEIDAIASRSGVAAPEVSAVLLQLELKRLVKQLPGKRFVRV